jgi:hypothetical protein
MNIEYLRDSLNNSIFHNNIMWHEWVPHPYSYECVGSIRNKEIRFYYYESDQKGVPIFLLTKNKNTEITYKIVCTKHGKFKLDISKSVITPLGGYYSSCTKWIKNKN